jgi:type IV secretion system protein VirB8
MKKPAIASRHAEVTVIGLADKSPASEPSDYFQQAANWETSRVLQLEKSERRAWSVATVSAVAVLLSWLAIVFMMPLKEAVPYVIRVDSATGVPDIVTTLKEKSVASDEVMDKFWVAKYVRAHETYDWYSLQEEYGTVNLLSSPGVAADYNRRFEGEGALDKKYGNNFRVTAAIASIVLNGRGVATVRFVRRVRSLAEGREDVSSWVATIGYEYRGTAKLRESMRLTNPFGFQALTYRLDEEAVGLTPGMSKEVTP